MLFKSNMNKCRLKKVHKRTEPLYNSINHHDVKCLMKPILFELSFKPHYIQRVEPPSWQPVVQNEALGGGEASPTS